MPQSPIFFFTLPRPCYMIYLNIERSKTLLDQSLYYENSLKNMYIVSKIVIIIPFLNIEQLTFKTHFFKICSTGFRNCVASRIIIMKSDMWRRSSFPSTLGLQDHQFHVKDHLSQKMLHPHNHWIFQERKLHFVESGRPGSPPGIIEKCFVTVCANLNSLPQNSWLCN